MNLNWKFRIIRQIVAKTWGRVTFSSKSRFSTRWCDWNFFNEEVRKSVPCGLFFFFSNDLFWPAVNLNFSHRKFRLYWYSGKNQRPAQRKPYIWMKTVQPVEDFNFFSTIHSSEKSFHTKSKLSKTFQVLYLLEEWTSGLFHWLVLGHDNKMNSDLKFDRI